MRYWSNYKLILALTFFVFCAIWAKAQPNDNSPFASLGIGNFLDQNFVHSSNMGGISAGYYDQYQWNAQNPASLGYLKYTSFNVAAYAERSSLQSVGNEVPNDNEIVWNGNLRYLSLGMPLRNVINVLEERKEQSFGAGMGLSLMPFTRAAQSTRFTEIDPQVGTIVQDIVREGGTYRLQWSGGARYRNFSAGVNLGYFFGTLDRNQVVSLSDDRTASITVSESSSRLQGFTSGYGVMYTLPLLKGIYDEEDDPEAWKSPRKSITFGIHGRFGNDFTTRSSRFERVIHGVGIVDTAEGGFAVDVKENGKLGAETTFGITYRDQQRLMIGSNLTLGQWSEYENESDPQTLSDSWRWSVGGTWRPDPDDVLNFWNRIGYQAGFNMGEDPRSLGGEQLSYWSVTAGLELPVFYTQQISHVSIGVEYGKVKSPVIEDSYLRFTLGMTFNDNKWFLKRKYD